MLEKKKEKKKRCVTVIDWIKRDDEFAIELETDLKEGCKQFKRILKTV